MVQDTSWLWLLLNLAGLLGLVVSMILIFANKGGSITSRLLGICLLCLSLGSFGFGIQLQLLSFSLTIISICFYLFLHPSILFGTSRMSISGLSGNKQNAMDSPMEKIQPYIKMETNAAPRATLSVEQSLKFKKLIEDHFSTSHAFRKQGYTIRDLANETGLPAYQISSLINQEYEMNFNELVNAYRVDYLAGLLNTSFDCASYTLEAIGKMAGFNSRTAFIAAIKKHTGMTPSAFFGRRNSENSEHQIFSNPQKMRDVA